MVTLLLVLIQAPLLRTVGLKSASAHLYHSVSVALPLCFMMRCLKKASSHTG